MKQMSYKKGIDKKQGTLLPICLDDYVPEDHICRVISAFIEQLDMVVGKCLAGRQTRQMERVNGRRFRALYFYAI